MEWRVLKSSFHFSTVIPDAAVDERRRLEIYNTSKTLDHLKASLVDKGCTLSRTSLHYR